MFKKIILWFKKFFYRKKIQKQVENKVPEIPPQTETQTPVVDPSNAKGMKAIASIYNRMTIDHPKLKTVTLAQWILESGWGKSKLAKDHHNYAGLKWRGTLGMKGVTKVEYAAHDGLTSYAKCDDIETFIRYYWKFLERSVYTGWSLYRNSPQDFIKYISKAGYNPDPRYPDKVMALIPQASKLLRS